MISLLLATVIYASPVKGEVFFNGTTHDAIYGKPATPTPTGTFQIKKVYSTHLKTNVIMFYRDGGGIYAVHTNLPSRDHQLHSKNKADNYLSNGCIGVSKHLFDTLWQDPDVSTIVIKNK